MSGSAIQYWQVLLVVSYIFIQPSENSLNDVELKYNSLDHLDQRPHVSKRSTQSNGSVPMINCENLQHGQYFCADPIINNETQQAEGCSKETQTVLVPCYPVRGLYCSGKHHDGKDVGFYKEIPCKWTDGVQFTTALLLSVFLGMFGIDRFYLGYPAIGLLKLCTLGFMLLGQLVDVLLIAMQVVGPSDGSNYVIDFYGPALHAIRSDNNTYFKPQYEYQWHHVNSSTEL